MAKSEDSLYTSCSCNRSPRCVAWGHNGLIAYAVCNAIALFKPKSNHGGKVLQTLVAHKKLVTSVQWIRKLGPENELLSTSADHTAIIWTQQHCQVFSPKILIGHSNVVKSASALYLLTGELLVATSSADSTVKIWKRLDDDVICTQTISLGNGFALDLKLTILNEVPLLAAGCDDSKIRLYSFDENNSFVILTLLSGHEDWIQGLDFIQTGSGDVLLASASQDHYIRIWKIFSDNSSPDFSETVNIGLKVKQNSFSIIGGANYIVTLESVLAGHENWIYSVEWNQQFLSSDVQQNGEKESLQILSASMDKTIIIWEFDCSSNLWLEKVRFGEVGGNTLGFYGAVFSPDGLSVIAHGYQGAVHLWSYKEKLNTWQPSVAFGGHFDSVQDISWAPDGSFLLSCSHDQTTRLHAPVTGPDAEITWHELARPQVHGYDMVCLSAISSYEFVSGGDEKILRVFKAPGAFAENFGRLCNVDTSSYLSEALPKGASVPSLGLSNKAVFDGDLETSDDDGQKHPKDMYPEFSFTPSTFSEPPTEEVLLQNTLWPEVQKLYGHPYEVFAVACNHQRTIVASSCKASKAEHATIILWDTSTWKQVGQLIFHALTVTQLEFSPNDRYLLSVSRDRMWAVYESIDGNVLPYQKVAHYNKKLGVHARIIWSCSWSPDNAFFATASRDKKVAVWSENCENSNEKFALASRPLEVEDSATAISFGPCLTNDERYILAIGYENGRILLCSWRQSVTDADCWQLHYVIDKNYAHHLSVNRLKFAPVAKQKSLSPDKVLLASCGSDHLVRIHSVVVSNLIC